MQTLAAAAEQAHRSGVSLSIDHPNRVRVSIEGDVALFVDGERMGGDLQELFLELNEAG